MLSLRHAGAICALLLSLRVAKFIHTSGELRVISNILAHTGRCKRVVQDHHGFEDFAFFERGELISFSSDHSHFAFRFGKSMRQVLQDGGQAEVNAYVMRGGTWQKLHVQNAPDDFSPHGLAGWGTIGSRDAQLLVVNHRTTHDSLELFSLRGRSTAEHQRSLVHPLFLNINDCVFASATFIYCTNWRSYETGSIADAVEVFGQQPWSYVVGCDLSGASISCDVAAKGIQMANGIEVRQDLVFVVASLEPAILVYSRGGDRGTDGSLELLYRMQTRAACDNLAWGPPPPRCSP